MKKFRISLLGFGITLLVGLSSSAAALVVTKTADTNDGVCDADCSLREAVAAAQPGDVIQFADGAKGIHQLSSSLFLDGKSRIDIDGGANHDVVIRGNLTIDASGRPMRESINCILIKGAENAIQGLVFQNCVVGVFILGVTRDNPVVPDHCYPSNKNVIKNNYFGTDVTGMAAEKNIHGIYIQGGQENVVGPGNLISGNSQYGIILSTGCTSLNRLEGNLIGTKINGTEALRNGRYGIFFQSGARANIIGGETPETRNIISANNWAGIVVTAGASHNIIQGNYIGTDREGKKALTNNIGIIIGQEYVGPNTNNNIVRGNVISGNANGVIIKGDNAAYNGAENNIIDKNIIGPAADLSPLEGFPKDGKSAGNYYNGIDVRGHNNIIGGDTPEEANILTQNGSYGIDVYPRTHGNRLKINSIYENFYAGIKLAETGHNNIAKPGGFVTAERDPAESDKMIIKGEGVKPSAKVDLYEFVLSGIALRERCQGKTFIGSTTADEAGRWEISLSGRFSDAGTLVTAVQTDNTDGFSPFADCFEIENKPPHLPELGDRGVTETQELVFNLNGVDANGNGLGYSCVRECPEGLTVGDEGQVRWTPPRGAGGRTYNVPFAVTDGVASDEKIANIIVERFDTTPQLADIENRTLFEKEDIAFNLEAADEDGDPPLFVFAQGQREEMEFNEQTGAFSWSPKKEDIGEHRVVFRARDNDKEHLFTEKEMRIEVKRKFPLPSIEIKKLKVVRAGEKLSLIAQLKEQLPELQYTFRWEVKEGEGNVENPAVPETEYIAPIVNEDRIEQIVIVVEDSEGNVSQETVSVVVLAKSAENPNIETPTTTGGGDDNLGNMGATGGGGTETEAGGDGEAEKGKGEMSGMFQCALNRNAAPSRNAAPFLILLLTLWTLRKRIQS